MKNTFTKILLVSMIATILPISTALAGGSMPATVLNGSLSADNTIQLSWNTPDKTTNASIYDFYEGYAVTMNNKPFAMLKFSNNNYSYYNLAGMGKGNYDFYTSLYYYDISGIHYVNSSNTVSLKIEEKPAPNPQLIPMPKPTPAIIIPPLVPSSIILTTVVPNPIIPTPQTSPKKVKLQVDQSSDKLTLNWTAYTGNFDGYVIILVEIGKTGKVFPKNTIYYYAAKTDTSFNGINIASGHKYIAQVFPYTGNGNGTLTYIENGKSNRKLVKTNEESGKIILTATAVGGKIEASFTTSNSKQVDGYAVYVVTGKKGEVNLINASPVFLAKDKTTFNAYPSDTGYYTLKVYAYNELSDGTKVYHQPGSNWVTVVSTTL